MAGGKRNLLRVHYSNQNVRVCIRQSASQGLPCLLCVIAYPHMGGKVSRTLRRIDNASQAPYTTFRKSWLDLDHRSIREHYYSIKRN
jgi:hypothetical protein